MSEQRTFSIRVPVLARVEGEGALELDVQAGAITDVKLRIYEPPRFFEKFLEGRGFEEVPDTVARICGICPVAYQMSAVHAIEAAFGVDPGPWVRAMRRVMYCGEWLQSHSLHIHLLAAPDFLGFDSVVGMAEAHAEAVRRGLMLQALGNDLIGLFGARSVHPVGVRVGGFHHVPEEARVHAMVARLNAALPAAEALVAWTAGLPLPQAEDDFVCVALRHSDEYPMNEGRLVSSDGLDCAIVDYEQHFAEEQVAHSTALHSHLHGRPYLVGPLARLNLNHDRLPTPVRAVLDRTDLKFPSRNMFHSVVARAIEVYFAVYEALCLLSDYTPPEQAYRNSKPRPGVGYGCTEAPRGTLWHRYELDETGHVRAARIVPPTSQNQGRIEEDLRRSLERFGLEHDDETLRLRGEMVIRNYDPCISCATHFLRLKVNRQ